MNEILIGAGIGTASSLYINLVSGRYFRFQDIIADLAHQSFIMRQRYEAYALDESTLEHLWRSTSEFIQTVFQPAYFRLELEAQCSAKREVGILMNEIIDEVRDDLQSVTNGMTHDTASAAPPEQLRNAILIRFEREKDRYVSKILAIKPSIRVLAFLESIR